jgi:peptidoglycan/xylan/chitin deacetylase (PgdA/CDA1 family)
VKFFRILLVVTVNLVPGLALASGESGFFTPILVYHKFNSTAADSMTVSTRAFESQLSFESQLDAIGKGGYHVIPLRELVDTILSGSQTPPRSIVITADDGDESIYTEMAPRLKSHGFPASFFIYPSAISNAKWAMTWPQLIELQNSGSFDIESHTYWHPNFHTEKRRLKPEAYKTLVDWQLEHSKEILERKLGKKIDLLSWPFGIYDDWLMDKARHAGYRAGFTIERRSARASDKVFALPRYLMTDAQQGAAFERFLQKASR